MAKIINKIAFIVHEPSMYDHWVGVWQKLEKSKFEIVFLDSFKFSPNAGFKKDSERFLKKINSKGYSFCFLSDFLKSGDKYSFVISNHPVQGNTLIDEPLPVKIKIKNKIKIVLNSLVNSLGITRYYPLTLSSQFLPMKIGIKRIRFMYGADINDGWSLGKWNEMFEIFLCHGPNDEREINRRFNGKTYQMGYPRYDDYFNSPDLGNDLQKEFSGSPEKKTVVWLPTLGDEICSIPYYTKQIAELSKDYNLIVRPHPLTFRDYPENISMLKNNKYIIDDDPLRDMNALYKIADFVICDYGGTQFSSLYLDKKIILLNVPGADTYYTSKKSSDFELRKELSPVLDIEESIKLEDILQDDAVWTKQDEQRQRIFAKYFAPYRGNSTARVVSILNELLSQNQTDIRKVE